MKKLIVLFLAALLLAGCGAAPAAPETTAAPAAAETTAAPETTAAAETTAAPAAETTAETVVETTVPLEPIYGDKIADGTYEITVDSSSSMFKIVKCVLVVENGKMTATMTMSGQGYGKLFMGTGEAALAAGEDQFIPFVLDEEGAKEFTVPVEALDMPIDCAAWSIKKEKWYDRVLVFESAQMPAEALKA